jgi:hypothetical protein
MSESCGNDKLCEDGQCGISESCVDNKLCTNNEPELEDQSFDYQDDTEIKDTDLSEYKYTKIDCLDEDPPIRGQAYVLLSFISPEGILNCKTRGLKVRGVYATETEARVACEKLRKQDPIFDIFVAEMGKWVPWNPSNTQVNEVNYKNKRQNKIMQQQHSKELANLNELVGRNKELVAKEKKAHKNRIRNSIKENIENLDDIENAEAVPQEPKEEKSKQQPRRQRNGDDVKMRLRKKLEEAEKKKMESGAYFKSKEESVKEQKTNVKAETDRIIEKENNVNKLQQKSDDLNDRLAKMKEYFNQKKLERQKKSDESA